MGGLGAAKIIERMWKGEGAGARRAVSEGENSPRDIVAVARLRSKFSIFFVKSLLSGIN